MFRSFSLWAIVFSLFVLLFANDARADQAGSMRYNAVSHKMEFYDGTRSGTISASALPWARAANRARWITILS